MFLGLAAWKSYIGHGKWLFYQDDMYKNEEKDKKLPKFLICEIFSTSFQLVNSYQRSAE